MNPYDIRDIAADQIRGLQQESLRRIQQYPEGEEAQQVASGLYADLFTKIEYKWHPSDRNALVQLRAAADHLLSAAFEDTRFVLDSFYASFRVPKLNSRDQVVFDADNKMVWEVDERGKPKEDFSSLTGQDIEECLFKLSVLRLDFSQVTSELFLEAVFAKHVYNDEWNEKYQSVLDGTVGDRNAKANRDARQSKYHAYFRYYVWHKADTFAKEISNVMSLLERIRGWRIRDPGEKNGQT